MIIDYPWYLALACIAVGIIYAAVLYFVGPKSFGRGLSRLLAAIRFLAVSAIAFLLLAPVARQTVHERQHQRVALVADRSLSVLASQDSNFIIDDIVQFGNDLSKHLDVMMIDDSAHSNRQTDLGAMLNLGSDAAAIVLASDGINNHGANPIGVAEKLGIPVFTLALGDTTPQRDAAITDIRVNRIAMLGSRFPLEITVTASLLDGARATLSVSDADGATLHSQAIEYTSPKFGTTFSVTLPADMPGLHPSRRRDICGQQSDILPRRHHRHPPQGSHHSQCPAPRPGSTETFY